MLFHQLGCVVMQVVQALVLDAFVDAGDLLLGFLQVLEVSQLEFDAVCFGGCDFPQGTLTPAGELALPDAFLFRQCPLKLLVFQLVSVRLDDQVGNPHVQPHDGARFRQYRNGFLHQDSRRIGTVRFLADDGTHNAPGDAVGAMALH